MLDAVEYTKSLIRTYYSQITAPLIESLQKPILNEMDNIILALEQAEDYIKNRNESMFFIFQDKSEHLFVMERILSCLRVYKMEIESIHKTTNVKEYEELALKISKALNEIKPEERTNLYLKYSVNTVSDKPNTVKFFISYQQNDVKTACTIQELILKNSSLKREDVFVAQRDIPLSEEWRTHMLGQLEKSTHLLAICTNNYPSSAFGNQEVGFAIAKGIKVAPIFWQGTSRNQFGFLESFQALPEFADDSNIELLVQKILAKFEVK
jgi:hypothetical protein